MVQSVHTGKKLLEEHLHLLEYFGAVVAVRRLVYAVVLDNSHVCIVSAKCLTFVDEKVLNAICQESRYLDDVCMRFGEGAPLREKT